MFRFGKRSGGDSHSPADRSVPPSAGRTSAPPTARSIPPNAVPEGAVKEAIGHLLKQLVRAESFFSNDQGSDKRLAAQAALLHVELSRATLASDYEIVCEKIAALRFLGDKLPDEQDSEALGVVRAWIHSGRGLERAVNDNEHAPALHKLANLAQESLERARNGMSVHMETLAQEVRWIRERGQLLSITVSQIGASLVTMAADGPLTRERLLAIREQIEAANDATELERLRRTLVDHTHRLIEEVDLHTKALIEVRDKATDVVVAREAPVALARESMIPSGLVGSSEMLDRALLQHAKTGKTTAVMLINREARISVSRVSEAVAASQDPSLELYCRRSGELLVLRSSDKVADGIEALRDLGVALTKDHSVTDMTHAVAAITLWGAGQSFESALNAASVSLKSAEPGATVLVTP